jgi:hypothetical protein
MKNKTMQTLVDYIAELHRRDKTLLHPEEYFHDEIDTNGVKQDHVETFWPLVTNERTTT